MSTERRSTPAPTAVEPEAPAMRLLALALSVRRMVEDGHPNDTDWFRIMCERVHTVDDLTDRALVDGAESVARRLAVEPDGLPLDVERLAAAWGNVMDGRRVEGVRLHPGVTTEADWVSIATEYARLAPSEARE